MSSGRPLSESLEDGRRLFNAGRFFEAHERWEEAWLRESGKSRLLLQGLIQIAAGFLKARQGNAGAAVRLLEAGAARVAAAGPPAELTAFCGAVRHAALRLQESGKEAVACPPLPPLEGGA